ncbi:MAG: chromosome segregation protein SMC [Inconstantimicrobium porci]|uniref:chromosome segregation protein SMC n=1 Tax=Inconstantimicrobium porci TaxID=2652291 RepID=UPI00240A6B9E|nr:chromosome segregation protein SMC [Inconstantimicrobium porci]MDD6772112.1 chromosome segregation protein SMC [Inconstantimicrobium porci]MDY5911263.1 chromosome segregation protein SMC [Inconstantimicrobium porci]
MFLKSIEIRGFKSFADKTKLDFRKGITAVVGPNGSGKSNISDAVRWVLGEQSARTLRGGKMDDVIFAGTQFRKPVGLAQVSLFLDNSDGGLPIEYSEVVVTRRIYRSGESEYLINNRQCRLKDIVGLFMDTGIGKEGYSLIGQGKIDAILNGKPEDRRALLEEASGIVKYKARKEESEKKLDSTNQNLVRIDDILSTYEDRIEPLRIESEKADQFIKLSKELKSNEITLLINNIEKFNDDINKINSELKSLTDSEVSCRTEYENSKNAIEEINKKIEELDSTDLEQRRDFYKCKEEKSALEAEINVLNERLNNIDDIINKSRYDKETAAKDIQKLNELKIKSENDYNIKKADIEHIELKVNEINERIKIINQSVNSCESEQSSAKKKQIELLKEYSDKNNDINLKEEQIKNLKSSAQQLGLNEENSKNLISINYSTKLKLKEQSEELKKQNDTLEDKVKELKKNMAVINSSITRNEEKFRRLSNEKNSVQANKNVLSRLEKQYEGYNKSVKNLFEYINNNNINIKSDSCAVLGEVINVEKKYELAIEIALGGAISNIITDNDVTAQKLIALLKNEKLGRATFLPLNIIKGRRAEIASSVLNMDGFIGIASDLVKKDKKYNNAIDYTLGRVLVSANMECALKIAKVLNYSFKIVTIDGQIVNPGGALTGGSIYNKHTSIITRKREIEELEKKEVEIDIKLKSMSEEISKLKKEIQEKDEVFIECKEEINVNLIDISRLDNEISNLSREAAKLQNELNLSSKKTEETNAQISNMIAAKEQRIEELKNIKKSSEDNDKLIAILEDKRTSLYNELNELNESFTNEKIKKASAQELVNSYSAELTRLTNEIEKSKNNIITFDEEMKKNIDNKTLWKEKIEENNKKIETASKDIKDMELKLSSREVEREKIKEQYKYKNSLMESKFLEMKNLQEKIHKIDINKARKEQENKALLVQLNEDYEMTYAEAVETIDRTVDIEKVVAIISSLKKKIHVLGTVNVAAIEEYKDLMEKYTFMSEQREDLTKTKDELTAVIEQLTEKMKEIFVENFKILNKYFNETFRELFKGGSAELKLASDDALTSSIEINVEPPGKKVQNINLMSGGEKVLSAIALVFAILKMKPTPFCILDEIEAALDDANVDRYADFLKQFSDNVQFIVITHRKGTMEAADIMYGVTMQEKGISKVVSVDLNK